MENIEYTFEKNKYGDWEVYAFDNNTEVEDIKSIDYSLFVKWFCDTFDMNLEQTERYIENADHYDLKKHLIEFYEKFLL